MSSPRAPAKGAAAPKEGSSPAPAAQPEPVHEPPTNTQIPFVRLLLSRPQLRADGVCGRPGVASADHGVFLRRTTTMATLRLMTTRGEEPKRNPGSLPCRLTKAPSAPSLRPPPSRRASSTTAASTGARSKTQRRPSIGAPTTTGRTTASTSPTTSW